MKNLQSLCEHPAIILNPQLKDLILLNRNYHCNGKDYSLDTFSHAKWYLDFPYKKFGRIKRSISIEDIPLYYVVDGDGERQPLFMSVPCGKCVVCREKKSKEWSTRAMCESQDSFSPPIFFTLTYNDICLPSNGVRKGACQRFLKRFRINLNRYMGMKCNIRYYICAEYGTKSSRPHYHGIFWNLPLLEPSHITYLIQKSWSFDTSKKYWDTIPNKLDKYGNPVFKYFDDKDKRHRILYGYTSNSVCTEGRVRYAMKYMRKDAQIPAGKNDIFFLSSRRGGLGYQWIEQRLDEYRKNPSLLDVQLTDVWSGKSYQGSLPRYFKDKIAPCTSRLIRKDIRDAFKLWNYYSNKFCTLIGYDYTPNKRVLERYPSLVYHRCRLRHRDSGIKLKTNRFNVYNYYRFSEMAMINFAYLPQIAKAIDNALYLQQKEVVVEHIDLDAYTRDLAKIVDYYESKLLDYNYDIGLSLSTPVYKREHLKYVEKFIDTSPSVSVPDRVFEINRSRRISSYREVM